MTLEELGAAIKGKREASGLSLADIASRIKVSSRILSTIEQGSLNGLPHAVYTKSFIRSFGQIVGYDHDELNAALEELFPASALDESKVENPILLANPTLSYSNTGKRIIIMIVLVLILLGLIGGGWYVATNYGNAIIELVKKPFHAITSSNEYNNPAFKKLTAASQPASSPSQQQRPGPEPSPEGSSVAQSSNENNTPAPAGVLASTPRDAAPASDTATTENGFEPPQATRAISGRFFDADKKHQVLLEGTDSCWLRITIDNEGKRDHTLQNGEQLAISYDTRLDLSIANPAGLSIMHDGKDFAIQGSKSKPIMLRFP